MEASQAYETGAVERCPDHEDYEDGCTRCFAEAVDGGVYWLVDESLPGTEAHEMPAPRDGVRVFELRFEGLRLFTFTYVRGDGLIIPLSADEILRGLRIASRSLVEHWNERIIFYEDAEDPEREHEARKRRGIEGARLDRFESWNWGAVADEARRTEARLRSRLTEAPDEPRRAV